MNTNFVKNISGIWLVGLCGLVGCFSYLVGILQAEEEVRRPQVTIVYPPESAIKTTLVRAEPQEEGFIASKNGTKYYPVGCSGASRINPENIVRYETEQAAKEAGLELSKTCIDNE